MAAYPPVDPSDPTEPLDSRPAKYGAEELRALKERVNDLETSIGAAPGVCGGRLTYVTDQPIMFADVAGAVEALFTPFTSDIIAVYTGTAFAPLVFEELVNDITDSTKNPAAVAPNSLYDLFVWYDSDTVRLGRGPAWASGTARGTGAGTTELQRLNGILVNRFAISNGPVAKRGTYVGTLETNAAGTLDFDFGGNAAGGAEIKFLLWNNYNQILFSCDSRELSTWDYDIATIRPLNNSLLNRIRFVRGVRGHHLFATLSVHAQLIEDAEATVGFGLDSITAFDGNCIQATFTSVVASGGVNSVQCHSTYAASPGIGVHYLQALERAIPSIGTGTTHFGPSTGIHAQWAG